LSHFDELSGVIVNPWWALESTFQDGNSGGASAEHAKEGSKGGSKKGRPMCTFKAGLKGCTQSCFHIGSSGSEDWSCQRGILDGRNTVTHGLLMNCEDAAV